MMFRHEVQKRILRTRALLDAARERGDRDEIARLAEELSELLETKILIQHGDMPCRTRSRIRC